MQEPEPERKRSSVFARLGTSGQSGNKPSVLDRISHQPTGRNSPMQQSSAPASAPGAQKSHPPAATLFHPPEALPSYLTLLRLLATLDLCCTTCGATTLAVGCILESAPASACGCHGR